MEEKVANEKGNVDESQNLDLQLLTSALTALKSQLEIAQQDLNLLKKLRDQAEQDPLEFIKKLQDKTLHLPRLQQIFQPPWRHLQKYGLKNLPNGGSGLYQDSTLTKSIRESIEKSYRLPKPAVTSLKENVQKMKVLKLAQELPPIEMASSSPMDDSSEDSADSDTFSQPTTLMEYQNSFFKPPLQYLSLANHQEMGDMVDIEGIDNNRLESPCPSNISQPHESFEAEPAEGGDTITPIRVLHNIPWSEEEQKKLEELLQVYPEEEVMAKRFKKIAAAMGTRTPRQVASRVQKYFIKLAKAGLSVPGRIPNVAIKPPTTIKLKEEASKKKRKFSSSINPSRKIKTKPSSMYRVTGSQYLLKAKPTVRMPEDQMKSLTTDSTTYFETLMCGACMVEITIGNDRGNGDENDEEEEEYWSCTCCGGDQRIYLCNPCYLNNHGQKHHLFVKIKGKDILLQHSEEASGGGEYNYLCS